MDVTSLERQWRAAAHPISVAGCYSELQDGVQPASVLYVVITFWLNIATVLIFV
jgi:hypothetical protein